MVGGWVGGWGENWWHKMICKTTAHHPVTQYRTCSVKNLVHLEISDKFSVFYRIIDFYAFLHTVAKRDLICRPIVYVYFILCMIARPKRFIKPKIMLMKSKLKTILIFVFQQIHFVFGQFLTAVLASRFWRQIWFNEKRMSLHSSFRIVFQSS